MRHRRKHRRLHQKGDHANLLLRNLATSLILYESVETTRNLARAVQPFIERLFTSIRDREPQVAARRLQRTLLDRQAARKVMEILRDRFALRQSGLTMISPLGFRSGDGAEIVRISFVDTATSPPRAKGTEHARKTSATSSTS
jgi:large subunit ribosomal protein L17